MGKPEIKRIRPRAHWREFALIRHIQRQAGRPAKPDSLGIGDDASAHCPRPGYLEIVTCDAMVEGVHWDFQWCTPRQVGEKIVAVNLSDIAAMAGIPERAHLVLAIPRRMQKHQVLALVRGITGALQRHQVALVGGDTVATAGPLVAALTLQGVVEEKNILTRAKAKPGDAVLVTGDLGAAAAALRLLERRTAFPTRCSYLRQRLLRPRPRLVQGRFLGQSQRVHAMMDISDGLAADLRRLTQASGVGAKLWGKHLPLSPAFREAARHLQQDPLQLALVGGEEYELLFTADPTHADDLCRVLEKKFKTPCTRIGEIVHRTHGLRVEDLNGKWKNLPQGWEHTG